MTTRGKHLQLAQHWKWENFPSLPRLTVDVCCVVLCFLFFYWGICAALMRSERGMPASLGGFKPPTSVYTHRAATTTAHAAQLQSHSAVFLLLSFNLQGREGAPRPRHTRLQICHGAERRTPKLAMGRPRGTCRPPNPQKNKTKYWAVRPSLAPAWLCNPRAFLEGHRCPLSVPRLAV